MPAAVLAARPQMSGRASKRARLSTLVVVLLSADGLVKSYGSGRSARRVLDGAVIAVERGELVAVVGPSGSGKSTLLHLLGGLDRPEAGTVRVNGLRFDGRSESELARVRQRHVGFVFQFFHLIPELTGAENVLLPSGLPGAPPDSRARARRLVDALGLREVADQRPHELSGGEQQRFAIARALVNDPAVVLADEPTGNLDADSGAAVLSLLRSIADEGRAVVMVTHERAATSLANRVLVLREGRLRG